MIEGSEELKAYIYEASRFPRVDLPMIEGDTYHSIYMNAPKMWNWTHTHGGPYYVEVGKNVSIKYSAIENVTVTINGPSTYYYNASSNETTD